MKLKKCATSYLSSNIVVYPLRTRATRKTLLTLFPLRVSFLQGAKNYYWVRAWFFCLHLRLTKERFRIGVAGFPDFSFPIIDHLTKNEKISFESYVLKHVQKSPKTLNRLSCRTNIILTLLKLGSNYGRTNVALGNYDNNHGFIRDNIDISPVLQSVFPDSSFEPAQSYRFSVALVQGDDHLYWFAQVRLLFYIKFLLQIVAGCVRKLAFVQFFEVMAPAYVIETELHCFSIRWATDDETYHSVNLNRTHSVTIEGEWYGAV